LKRKFPITGDGSVAHHLITVDDRADDAHYDHTPDEVHLMEQSGTRFVFRCRNGISLEIIWLSPVMTRFRYSLEGVFERDFSYATNPDFHGDPHLSITTEESPEVYLLSSGQLRCYIEKSDLRVHLADGEGRWICREKQGFYGRSTILRGKIRLAVSKVMAREEHFYGLGDKTGALCLNGQVYENWNTDAYSFGIHTGALYKSIPFVYGMGSNGTYGIFLDNTYCSRFDFGKEQKGEFCFEAAGGEMRYYFFYGPGPTEVAIQYAKLTGVPELPPMWALGFHQSRWSYFPDTRVLEVAKTFRECGIPCDSIFLDIDYMDGYRCFTWDPVHFPDPKGLIRALRELGFQTVVMIDPGIKIDRNYRIYEDGLERDVFCYRGDGDLMTGPVWPQECVFPDFTREDVREWWGDLYRELFLEQGVSGFWNDMNEPAVFKIKHLTFPDDVRHDFDGQPTNHRKAHNIYGQQMARATFEGLRKLDPGRRPFVLTRASFSGGQRHAATWTGDNTASWEHMRLAHRQAQRLSICGFSFCGSDIGGFEEQPDGEMMLRWLQLGVFHPFFRIHSMGNNLVGASEVDPSWVHEQEAAQRLDQEPWTFGAEWERLNKLAIEWRYQWLPYLYTCFRNLVRTGVPILRSLVFFDPDDPRLRRYEDGVWFGADVLVYPVLAPGQKTKTIYLPRGAWMDYWTGKRLAGGRSHRVALRLDRIPLFVHPGAILPHHSIRMSTAFPAEELILRVYPGGEEPYRSWLYEDAGEGYGEFLILNFEFLILNEGFRLKVNREGKYPLEYKRLRVQVPGGHYGIARWGTEVKNTTIHKWGTELVLDPFPWQGEDPVFELTFEGTE